jgi:hypothetical protein
MAAVLRHTRSGEAPSDAWSRMRSRTPPKGEVMIAFGGLSDEAWRGFAV